MWLETHVKSACVVFGVVTEVCMCTHLKKDLLQKISFSFYSFGFFVFLVSVMNPEANSISL